MERLRTRANVASRTGALNIHVDERGDYIVDIRAIRNGVRIRRVKRTDNLTEAVLWRNEVRAEMGLPRAVA